MRTELTVPIVWEVGVGPKFSLDALEREISDPTGTRARFLGCIDSSLENILNTPSRCSSSDRILREDKNYVGFNI
jgi:hypothetical protein